MSVTQYLLLFYYNSKAVLLKDSYNMYAEWIDWHQKAVVEQNQANLAKKMDNSTTPSSTSSSVSGGMYLIEDEETSSTTTEDNEDVETVKTAAEIGRIILFSNEYLHLNFTIRISISNKSYSIWKPYYILTRLQQEGRLKVTGYWNER